MGSVTIVTPACMPLPPHEGMRSLATTGSLFTLVLVVDTGLTLVLVGVVRTNSTRISDGPVSRVLDASCGSDDNMNSLEGSGVSNAPESYTMHSGSRFRSADNKWSALYKRHDYRDSGKHEKDNEEEYSNDYRNDDDDDSDSSRGSGSKKPSMRQSGSRSIQSTDSIVSNIGNTITIINIYNSGASSDSIGGGLNGQTSNNLNLFTANAGDRSEINPAAVKAFCASMGCNQFNNSPSIATSSGSATFSSVSSGSGDIGMTSTTGTAGSTSGSEPPHTQSDGVDKVKLTKCLLVMAVLTQLYFT